MANEQIPAKRNGLNTNTYVSVGVLAALLGGFWAVLNTVYSAKSEIVSRQSEFINRQDKFEMKMDLLTTRIDKLDKAQETWGFQDQFKWTVHLQRDNEGKIKVPEPEPSK